MRTRPLIHIALMTSLAIQLKAQSSVPDAELDHSVGFSRVGAGPSARTTLRQLLQRQGYQPGLWNAISLYDWLMERFFEVLEPALSGHLAVV